MNGTLTASRRKGELVDSRGTLWRGLAGATTGLAGALAMTAVRGAGEEVGAGADSPPQQVVRSVERKSELLRSLDDLPRELKPAVVHAAMGALGAPGMPSCWRTASIP